MPSGSKRQGISRDKVRAHRERLRARRLRLIEVWLADTRTAAFAAEAHRQSQLVARSQPARQDQEFIDEISLSLTGGGNQPE
jgi:hypothetical protein